EIAVMEKDEQTLAAFAVERIRSLLAEGHRSVAIVAKTVGRAESAHRLLREQRIKASYVAKEAKTFPSGVIVLPSCLAKGLEFDAVIVWDAGVEEYARESERKLLYTVCTRALHHLVMTSCGGVSPLLSNIPRNLFTLV